MENFHSFNSKKKEIAGGSETDIETEISKKYINIDNFANEAYIFNFHFEKEDLFRLSEALRMPDRIRTYEGNKVTGEYNFWIHRLYPITE